MASFLRYLSLLHAGLWLGAAGWMFGVALIIFATPDFDTLLQAKAQKGQAGQIFFQRFYLVQYCCAGAATLLLLLEWRFSKQAFPKWRFALLVLISGLVAGGGLWLSPKLDGLFKQKYPEYFQQQEWQNPARRSALQEAAAQAAQEHAKWHRISEGGFSAEMALLLIYFAANCRPLTRNPTPKTTNRKFEFRVMGEP